MERGPPPGHTHAESAKPWFLTLPPGWPLPNVSGPPAPPAHSGPGLLLEGKKEKPPGPPRHSPCSLCGAPPSSPTSQMRPEHRRQMHTHSPVTCPRCPPPHNYPHPETRDTSPGRSTPKTVACPPRAPAERLSPSSLTLARPVTSDSRGTTDSSERQSRPPEAAQPRWDTKPGPGGAQDRMQVSFLTMAPRPSPPGTAGLDRSHLYPFSTQRHLTSGRRQHLPA